LLLRRLKAGAHRCLIFTQVSANSQNVNNLSSKSSHKSSVMTLLVSKDLSSHLRDPLNGLGYDATSLQTLGRQGVGVVGAISAAGSCQVPPCDALSCCGAAQVMTVLMSYLATVNIIKPGWDGLPQAIGKQTHINTIAKQRLTSGLYH
jgi:hypothetical protein